MRTGSQLPDECPSARPVSLRRRRHNTEQSSTQARASTPDAVTGTSFIAHLPDSPGAGRLTPDNELPRNASHTARKEVVRHQEDRPRDPESKARSEDSGLLSTI